MDLRTVTRIRAPRSRGELRLAAGEGFLAGGSLLFSQPGELTGLVDLTAMAWPALTVTEASLSIAATCSVAELVALPINPDWPAQQLFRQCAESLFMSFKVWPQATVGGNLATALPAGAMTSLTAALDAELLIWRADGRTERIPVAAFITGIGRTILGRGDLVRSIEIPAATLRQRTAFRRMSLSPQGRSATLVIGRTDPAVGLVITITGGVDRPRQLRYSKPPSREVLADDLAAIDSWFTDPHGEAAWRRHISELMAIEIVTELTKQPWT